MRVIVCGGRDYADEARVHAELDALRLEHGDLIIIEGGAIGADRFGRWWAVRHFMQYITFEANWKKYGKAAGPIRNAKMLREGKPDVGLAFPSEIRGLEGTGTGDMVQRMRDAGIPVNVVQEKKGLGLC